jgi:hypothetical protein
MLGHGDMRIAIIVGTWCRGTTHPTGQSEYQNSQHYSFHFQSSLIFSPRKKNNSALSTVYSVVYLSIIVHAKIKYLKGSP